MRKKNLHFFTREKPLLTALKKMKIGKNKKRATRKDGQKKSYGGQNKIEK